MAGENPQGKFYYSTQVERAFWEKVEGLRKFIYFGVEILKIMWKELTMRAAMRR